MAQGRCSAVLLQMKARASQETFLMCTGTPPRSEDAKAKGEDNKEEAIGNEGKIEKGQSGNRLVDVEERNVGVVGWKCVPRYKRQHENKCLCCGR